MRLGTITAAAGMAMMTLTACSTGESTAEGPPEPAETKYVGGTSDDSDVDAEPGRGQVEGQTGTGMIRVDGITVTFTPEVCVFSSDDPREFSANGPGRTDGGEPAFVDIVGPNQFLVYLDADPSDQTNYHYEFNPMAIGGGPLDELDELIVDGTTVTAAPEMVRTDQDKTTFTPVGAAMLELTCP